VKEIVLENKAPFETVAENLKVKLVELGEERYIVCLDEEEAKRTRRFGKRSCPNSGKRSRRIKEDDRQHRVPPVSVRRQGRGADRREEDRLGDKVRRDLRPAYQTPIWSAKNAALCLQGVVAGGAGVPGDQEHLRDRPVYLSREDRIKGHIAVCFLAFCLQVAFLRIVRAEEKLKELSARAILQDLSESGWFI